MMKKTFVLNLFAFLVFVPVLIGQTPPPPPPPAPAPVEDVFKVVDVMPRFPGCEELEDDDETKKRCADEKMLQFIYKNLKYPVIARQNGVEGICVIQFVIFEDGSISNAKIVREIGGGCGEETLRIVNLMNEMEEKWIPGQQKGEPVRVQLNLPVKFRLEKPKKKSRRKFGKAKKGR